MTKDLAEVLNGIAKEYDGEILPTAGVFNMVDIGLAAVAFGKPELKERYEKVNAIIPLRRVKKGLNIEVDGSGLSYYIQLESGMAIPKYVADEAGLTGKPYIPRETMILNTE